MSSMDRITTINLLRTNLDLITKYLRPLLPLANCHMVEFLTDNHWERLVPRKLREQIDGWDMNEAILRFWSTSNDLKNAEENELTTWISTAKKHCVAVNNQYCLSVDQFKKRIVNRGGQILPEIEITQFMSAKKSYEVQQMSALVASVHQAIATTCCIEAGGGRGHLLVALSLGYGIPSLTVDCDEIVVENAKKRVKIIQKQWHAISKKLASNNELSDTTNKDLHQFIHAYITKDTQLTDFFKQKFPNYAEKDVKVLLTGLHTCGNLGPDSLRIFLNQPSISAIFNVPCCYHFLTEFVDSCQFDVFEQRFSNCNENREGFPMSDYLKDYNLGRNARMLAAQSIDRVVIAAQLPVKSLLYRAVLQAIIKDHLPNAELTEGKLKRAPSKSEESFDQYFKEADAILNLNLFDKLSDSYLTAVKSEMDSQWKKLVMFYLLSSEMPERKACGTLYCPRPL